MRKTPITRSTPLRSRASSTTRKPAPARDWTDARAKVDAERTCRIDDRIGACAGRVQAAHVIGREHDEPRENGLDDTLWVNPLDVVPLCTTHHAAYDARKLDLLPYLTTAEQGRAVMVSGGIIAALRRTTGGR